MLRIALFVLGLFAALFAVLHYAEPWALPGLTDARDWYRSHVALEADAGQRPDLAELLGPAAELPQPDAEGKPQAPEWRLLSFGFEGLRTPGEDPLDAAFRLRMQRAKAPAYRPVVVPGRVPLREIRASLERLAEAGPRPVLRILLVLELEELAPLCELTPLGPKEVDPRHWPKLPPLTGVEGWARLPILSLQEREAMLLASSGRDRLPRVLWPLFRKSPKPDEELRRWRRYEAELDGIRLAIERLQARALVAWRGHPVEWHSDAVSDLLEAHSAEPGSFESARARRRLQDLCSSRKLGYVDLGAALQRAPRGMGPILEIKEGEPWRWRPSELGRNVMLEALCPRLARLLRRN